MRHLDEGTIHAWLDSALNDDEAAEAERHVTTCTECRARVAEARGLLAGASRILSALDDVPGGVVPAPERIPEVERPTIKRRWVRPMAWAIAAGLMLAVGVKTVGRNDGGPVGRVDSTKGGAATGGAIAKKAPDTIGNARAGKPVVAETPKRAAAEPARDNAVAQEAERPMPMAASKAKGIAPLVSRPVPPAETAAKVVGGLVAKGALAGVRANALSQAAASPAPGAAARSEAVRALDSQFGVVPMCYGDGLNTIVLDTLRARPDTPAMHVLRDTSGVVGEWQRTSADSVTLFWGGRVMRGVVEPATRGMAVEGKVWARTRCRTGGP